MNAQAILNRLESLEAKATKGPWEWDDEPPAVHSKEFFAERAPWLIQKSTSHPVLSGEICAENPNDTALIVAMRNAIKPLIAALRHQDETIKTLAEVRYNGYRHEYAKLREAELTAILSDVELNEGGRV